MIIQEYMPIPINMLYDVDEIDGPRVLQQGLLDNMPGAAGLVFTSVATTKKYVAKPHHVYIH
jgi:hypothetical protein